MDYLEERWPSLAAFATENPGGDNGYSLMMHVALAYRRVGDETLADEALELVDTRMQRLEREGIDNRIFTTSKASYLAMRSDIDGALDHLEAAVAQGLSVAMDPEVVFPEFSILLDNPRFDEIKKTMLANLNYNRQILGLPPFDENYHASL